jgi:8-oxo-dGTP diphosphatase
MIKVICGVIFINNDTFIIGMRPDDYEDGGMWEFPGGKLEEGETDQECLKREWIEELGVEISVSEKIYEMEFGKYQCIFYNGFIEHPEHIKLHEHQKVAFVNKRTVLNYNIFEEDKKMIPFIYPPKSKL